MKQCEGAMKLRRKEQEFILRSSGDLPLNRKTNRVPEDQLLKSIQRKVIEQWLTVFVFKLHDKLTTVEEQKTLFCNRCFNLFYLPKIIVIEELQAGDGCFHGSILAHFQVALRIF